MIVVGYNTQKEHSTNIVKAMLHSVGGTLLSTYDHVPQCDLVIICGILRGSGLIYKHCVKNNIPFLFLDHAYFNKGYQPPGWMRVSLSRHCFGPNFTNSLPNRFQKYFSNFNLEPWQGGKSGHILILPPTHAISWLFDDFNWLTNTITAIKQVTDLPIVVRNKPEDPIVDEFGNLIRMEKSSNTVSFDEDILNSCAVVSYNSNSVIRATQLGIPIICTENCAAYPISFSLNDLTNLTFNEPNRLQWFYDLANAQFTLDEMRQGKAYSIYENKHMA